MKTFSFFIFCLFFSLSLAHAGMTISTDASPDQISVDLSEVIQGVEDPTELDIETLISFYRNLPINALQLPLGVSQKKFKLKSGAFIMNGSSQEFGLNHSTKFNFTLQNGMDAQVSVRLIPATKTYIGTISGARAEQAMKVLNAGHQTLPFAFVAAGGNHFEAAFDSANSTIVFTGNYEFSAMGADQR